MSDVVWTSRLDEKWDVTVVRVDQDNAFLTIVDMDSGETVFTKPVLLSYGAQFGPDVADVAEWQELAVAVVDSM